MFMLKSYVIFSLGMASIVFWSSSLCLDREFLPAFGSFDNELGMSMSAPFAFIIRVRPFNRLKLLLLYSAILKRSPGTIELPVPTGIMSSLSVASTTAIFNMVYNVLFTTNTLSLMFSVVGTVHTI